MQDIPQRYGFKSWHEYRLSLLERRGMSDKEYRKILAQRQGLCSHTENLERIARNAGYDSRVDYTKDWLRKRGFRSAKEYRGHLLKKGGFRMTSEYFDDLARRRGFKSRLEHKRYRMARKNIELALREEFSRRSFAITLLDRISYLEGIMNDIYRKLADNYEYTGVGKGPKGNIYLYACRACGKEKLTREDITYHGCIIRSLFS
jgi:rubrerythrin